MNLINREVKLNLHSHSTLSDGVLEVSELCETAVRNELEYFSVTDHDVLEGNCEAERRLKNSTVKYVNGVEMSFNYPFVGTVCNVHVLNYNFNYNKLSAFYSKKSAVREKGLKTLIRLLCKKGYGISANDFKSENLTRTNIAIKLIEKGYFKTRNDVYQEILNNDEYKEYFGLGGVNFDEMNTVDKANGTLIWAHPFEMVSDGLKYEIDEEAVEKILKSLLYYGVKGIEAHYHNYSLAKRKFLISLADKYSLLVSAGTDFHGRKKNEGLFIKVKNSKNLITNLF